MSAPVTANYAASFDAMVKRAYQGASKLKGTVRTKTGVVGSTHRFHKMGKGMANPRIPQTDVVPMNVSHTNATATLQDWEAPEYTDVYDINKITYDERKELATTIAGGMGRRLDQIIIDAMAASANTTQVSEDLGGTNSGLKVEKILRASRLMNQKGVPESERYMAISAIGLEIALQETEIGSSDFNVMKSLYEGTLNKWGTFQFIMIEDRDEGGIPLSSNIRNNFAYHKEAVGLAIGMNMRTEVNYVPTKTSYLSNGLMSAGAVTIDTDGVYDVLTYEA